MSSISPISVRIASKTRFFETTGDSSYYYSSQLLTNMALLKAVTKLGQQLGWPSKVLDNVPKTKQGSAFLAKASQSVVNSRTEPLINLKATPGKEWISANLKLVNKLTTSQQFFNSKAIGFLAKGLGRSGKFDPVSQLGIPRKVLPRSGALGCEWNEQLRSFAANQQRYSRDSANNKLFLKEDSWFTSFNYLAQLAKYCNTKYYKQPLSRYPALTMPLAELAHRRPQIATNLLNIHKPRKKLVDKRKNCQLTLNKKGFTNNSIRESTSSYKAQSASSQKTSITKVLRKESKQAFKTATGLSFYLTALGLVGHSQVLRSSLVIAPIVSGSLQSNLLLSDHKKVIKIASSNGIGLVSTSPKCYISRSTKDTALNFFYKIPAKLAEKRVNNRPQYHQVYVLADLQGLRKPQKRLKPTYASVRWL